MGGYGLRASTEMTARKCFWSMLVPWHNEFLAILLTTGFLIYFLVLLIIILND